MLLMYRLQCPSSSCYSSSCFFFLLSSSYVLTIIICYYYYLILPPLLPRHSSAVRFQFLLDYPAAVVAKENVNRPAFIILSPRSGDGFISKARRRRQESWRLRGRFAANDFRIFCGCEEFRMFARGGCRVFASEVLRISFGGKGLFLFAIERNFGYSL